MKKYFHKIHYSKNLSAVDKLFKKSLKPISYLYFLGTKFRNYLYNSGKIKTYQLDAKVISIGNLTTGGTGKTPITCEIARYLKSKCNKSISILSHGYGGSLSTKRINLISDGTSVFHSAQLAGDEPYWMAVNTSGIPVITSKDRVASGQYSIDNFNSELLVLDDGYQHIKLERDLNILVIDCIRRFGNNLLLPAGPLREQINQIERADKIILVNKNSENKESCQICEDYAKHLIGKYSKPVFICNFYVAGIYNILDQKPIDNIQNAFAFTGIAQPASFFDSLENQGVKLTSKLTFPDHHLYTRFELNEIIRQAKELKSFSIITTEKDAVKISALLDEVDIELPIYALKQGLDLDLKNLLGEYANTGC